MTDLFLLIALLVALGAAVLLAARLGSLPVLQSGLLRPLLPLLYVQTQVILAAVYQELRARVQDTDSKWDDELLAELIVLVDAAVHEAFLKLGYRPQAPGDV